MYFFLPGSNLVTNFKIKLLYDILSIVLVVALYCKSAAWAASNCNTQAVLF